MKKEFDESVNNIINSTLEKLSQIVDTNTIIGQLINVGPNIAIVPISKLSLGYVAGGGDFANNNKKTSNKENFTGGSGSGFYLSPVGFLCIANNNFSYLSCEQTNNSQNIISIIDKFINKVVDDKKDISIKTDIFDKEITNEKTKNKK